MFEHNKCSNIIVNPPFGPTRLQGPGPSSNLHAMAENRYHEVARELASGMATGRYPVGSLLPTELELCELFGASRHTIRAAMRELTEQGLISRRKRAGTRVESAQPRAGYDHALASVADLEQLAETARRDVQRIDDIVADRKLAKVLGCAPGTPWLRISSVRRDSGAPEAPICWTDVYVDAAYADLRQVVRKLPRTLMSSIIETRYGRRSAEIHQSITATGVPAEHAEALNVPAGTPALRILRRYVDRAGKAFEITSSIHPENRFTFSMVLRPGRSRA